MQQIGSRIYKTLISEATVVTSGWTIGATSAIAKENKDCFKKYPLSTLFTATISGFFCAVGASIVGSFMPPPARLSIPIVATVSSVYHLTNNDAKEKRSIEISINLPQANMKD